MEEKREIMSDEAKEKRELESQRNQVIINPKSLWNLSQREGEEETMTIMTLK